MKGWDFFGFPRILEEPDCLCSSSVQHETDLKTFSRKLRCSGNTKDTENQEFLYLGSYIPE